uniref:TLC domain-containing protein n=1 Tax=Acrobeloides nanus TaxID=290746 RepID=A0A914DLZ3_9BILA
MVRHVRRTSKATNQTPFVGSFLFAYGCWVLHDKPWLYDVKQCWISYPTHTVDNSIWWYYMSETGFYYALLFASVFDVRRSDFWELVLHHIITIGLLSASWTINFVRVGTLILLSHDVADIALEFGKLVKYTKRYHGLTNIIFVLFLLSWFVTRLGYFPFVLLWSAFTDAPRLIQPDYKIWSFQIPHVPRIIIILLLLLLFLHIFWTVLILRIVVRTVQSGEECSDVRSDSEEEPSEEVKSKAKLLTKRKNMENGKKHS